MLLLPVFAFAQIQLPEFKEPVFDATQTLSNFDKLRLNRKIRNFSDTAGSQIGIVIVNSTDGIPINDYALDVAEQWELGRAGKNDGLLILVAKNDRKVRIEVGYGLEGAIPDIYAKRIIDNIMVNEFKEGKFYEGLNDATDAIIGLIGNEEIEGINEVSNYNNVRSKVIGVIGFITAFAVIILIIMTWWKNITYYSTNTTFFGKVKYLLKKYRWFLLSSLVIIVGIAFYSIALMGVAILFFILTFGAIGIVSGPRSSSSSSSSYSSSSYSSYSSSSSSSSSYSGGGGSFGGGGASGSW